MVPPLERAPDSSAQLLNVLVDNLPWPEGEHGAGAVPAPAPPAQLSSGKERRPARQLRATSQGQVGHPGAGAGAGGRTVQTVGSTATASEVAPAPPAAAASENTPGIRMDNRPRPPPAAQKPAWGFASGAPKKAVRNKDEEAPKYAPKSAGHQGSSRARQPAGRSAVGVSGVAGKAKEPHKLTMGFSDEFYKHQQHPPGRGQKTAVQEAREDDSVREDDEFAVKPSVSSFMDTMKLMREELEDYDDVREDSAGPNGGRTPIIPPPPLFIPGSIDTTNLKAADGSPGHPPGPSSSNSSDGEPPAAEITPAPAKPVFYRNFSESMKQRDRQRQAGMSSREVRGDARGSQAPSPPPPAHPLPDTTVRDSAKDLATTPKAAKPTFYKNFSESQKRRDQLQSARSPSPDALDDLPMGPPMSSAEGESLDPVTPKAAKPVFYKNLSESRKRSLDGVSSEDTAASAEAQSISAGKKPMVPPGSRAALGDSATDLPLRQPPSSKPTFFHQYDSDCRNSGSEAAASDVASSSNAAAEQEISPAAPEEEKPKVNRRKSVQFDRDESELVQPSSNSQISASGRSLREQLEERKKKRRSASDDAMPPPLGASSGNEEDGEGAPQAASVGPGSGPVFFTTASDWAKKQSTPGSTVSDAQSKQSEGPTVVNVKPTSVVRVTSRRNTHADQKQYVKVNDKGETVYCARNGLDLEWTKPNLVEAERVQSEAQAHHTQYSVWGTRPSTLHAFGAGVGLFFWMSKWLVGLMLVLCVLSTPAMIIFAGGGYAAGTWWPIAPNLASLGDFGPVWDTSAVAISSPALSATSQLSLQAQAELSLRDIWWQAGEPGYRVPISQSLVSEAMAKSSLLLFVSYADFAATLVVAGVALWLFFRARKMEQSLDDKNWTISDYTVKVTGLPAFLMTQQLLEHFEPWGTVNRVEIVHDDGWFYDDLVQRGRVVEMAEREVGGAIAEAGDNYIEEMFGQLAHHVKESSSELLDAVGEQQDNLRIVSAFVTFESADTMQQVVDRYAPYTSPLFSPLLPVALQLQDGSRIRVERAPEPTNVQFEHLGVRAAARLWCGATTWAWLILTLAVGFVLLSLTVSFKVEDAERGGGVGTQHAMLWVGVLVVLSTNLTLWWLGLRAASHEAHPTFSEQRSAATLKLSVALIASTGFLALAANILAPFAASAGFSPTFLGGVFPDFTPRWYHEVGLTLFVTVLACAAFAAARPAALAFVSASRRRRADMAVIQCDMNAALKGPSWDMRVRQALHSAVLATVLIFGSAMPLLYVGGLLYFTTAYFGDKFALLRVCRLPPLFGGAGIRQVPAIMGAALLGRLGVAAWAFSFPHAGTNARSAGLGHPLDRLTDSAAIVHFATLAALLAIALVVATVRALWATSRALFGLPLASALLGRPTRDETSALAQPTFADLLASGKLVGPDSYSLRNAVWYAPWHVEALLTAALQLAPHRHGIDSFMRRVEARHAAAVAARKAAAELSAPKEGSDIEAGKGASGAADKAPPATGARYLMQPGCESAKMPPPAPGEEPLGLGLGLGALLDVFLGQSVTPGQSVTADQAKPYY